MDVLDLDSDGLDDILLSGFDNEYKVATRAVLDQRNERGISAQSAKDRQLKGFRPANEKAVILIPEILHPRETSGKRFDFQNLHK